MIYMFFSNIFFSIFSDFFRFFCEVFSIYLFFNSVLNTKFWRQIWKIRTENEVRILEEGFFRHFLKKLTPKTLRQFDEKISQQIRLWISRKITFLLNFFTGLGPWKNLTKLNRNRGVNCNWKSERELIEKFTENTQFRRILGGLLEAFGEKF